MRVFMFQPRFTPLVAEGLKTQTIRANARCKVGDDVSLRTWQGKPYRSRHRILHNATCVSVQRVHITRACPCVDGRVQPRDQFAHADGFLGWQEMRDWFESAHGLPFNGDLVKWPAPKAKPALYIATSAGERREAGAASTKDNGRRNTSTPIGAVPRKTQGEPDCHDPHRMRRASSTAAPCLRSPADTHGARDHRHKHIGGTGNE